MDTDLPEDDNKPTTPEPGIERVKLSKVRATRIVGKNERVFRHEFTQREAPPANPYPHPPRLSVADMAPPEKLPVRPNPELIEQWPLVGETAQRHPVLTTVWRKLVGKPPKRQEQED